MVGWAGDCAGGLSSVWPLLGSCFLLGGLGEGQGERKKMVLISAEILTTDFFVGGSCAHLPSLLGWMSPRQDRDKTCIYASIASFNIFYSPKKAFFPLCSLRSLVCTSTANKAAGNRRFLLAPFTA